MLCCEGEKCDFLQILFVQVRRGPDNPSVSPGLPVWDITLKVSHISMVLLHSGKMSCVPRRIKYQAQLWAGDSRSVLPNQRRGRVGEAVTFLCISLCFSSGTKQWLLHNSSFIKIQGKMHNIVYREPNHNSGR
jgi:hypothetical protein